MGSLTLIKGDLWQTSREVVVNGVNCCGKMASGFAAQVRKRYPEAYRAYLRRYERGLWKLGDCQIVMTDQYRRHVANLATQERYGRDGRQYASYAAIHDSFAFLLDVCEKNKWGVAAPLVGCGLGGCEWPKVEAILRGLLAEREVELDVHYLGDEVRA